MCSRIFLNRNLRGVSQIRKAKWRRGRTENARFFVHRPLLMLKPIRAAQGLSSDSRFDQIQSRDTLPLRFSTFARTNNSCSHLKVGVESE